MTVLRGTIVRRRHALSVAGLVVLLIGVGGVDAAVAGPPDHAKGDGSGASADHASGASSSKGDGAAPASGKSGASDDDASTAVSAQRLDVQGPGRSAQAPPSSPPGQEGRDSASNGTSDRGASSGTPAAENRSSAGPSERGRGAGPPAVRGSPRSAEGPRTPPPAAARPNPAPQPQGEPPEPEARSSVADDAAASTDRDPAVASATADAPTPADGSTAPMAEQEPADGASVVGATPTGIEAPVASTASASDVALDESLAAGTGAATSPGPSGQAHLFDGLSRGTSRAVDTVLTPGRDFGVPALLVATLGVYLLIQRRLDRGALPMSALASSPDGNPAHVRFEL